jgi:nucleoside-diphosphate-sugar epimerase
MKMLVAGASGFLGQHVVREALSRGHQVRTVVRPAGKLENLPWAEDERLELAQVDLRSRAGLVEAMDGVDLVVHAAAAKSGDLYAQMAGTVVATENLLWAMEQAGVKRLVAISTFSVYAYSRMWCWSELNEDSPVEENAFERDEYAITKLIQERLVREAGARPGWSVTVLRPGVIYGKDNTWTARLGARGDGRTWVRIGAWARLPLTYVENCAEAIVMAAESDAAGGQVLNVVDDQMPTQRRYVNELRKRLHPRPRIVPVPYLLMRGLASLAWMTNKLLGGRAKLPGILVPARFNARFKPLRYSNARIKRVLGWTPRYDLAAGLDRSFGAAQTAPRTDPAVEVAKDHVLAAQS